MNRPRWMCIPEWEHYFNSPDWDLVHNGQQNPDRFNFPPDEVRCFTRKYRSTKSKGWQGLVRSVTFQYDLRNGHGHADITKIEFVSEDNNHNKTRETFQLKNNRR